MEIFKQQFGKELSEEKVNQIVKKSISESKNQKPVAKEITIGIQLLLLHYLNLLNAIDCSNKTKSTLLSVLLKTEGDENIRKSLSNIGGTDSKYLTKENLNYLLSLFNKLGLEDLQNKVQKDLDKISKKLVR